MTPFEKHKAEWEGCTRCPLHLTRNKVVLCRGKLPCDVLFVAEAPGHTEDSSGVPLNGPAGLLLDCENDPPGMIQRAGLREMGLRLAFTNLLGCIPVDDTGSKIEEPEDDHIQACAPRLVDFTRIVRPRLIVCVGRHARDWLDRKNLHSVQVDRAIPRVNIIHPSALFQMQWVRRGPLINETVVTLRNACKDLLSKPRPVLSERPEEPRSRILPSYRDKFTDPLPDHGLYGDDIPF